uniref:Uncharacterized protein n=1 Tax=Arundo donax TaxID=35708 RepID=A0A0A9FAF9_ARUDO
MPTPPQEVEALPGSKTTGRARKSRQKTRKLRSGPRRLLLITNQQRIKVRMGWLPMRT